MTGTGMWNYCPIHFDGKAIEHTRLMYLESEFYGKLSSNARGYVLGEQDTM
jgi:hypothetical protein